MKRVGQYQVMDELFGSGCQGSVFPAYDSVGQPVAIKAFAPGHDASHEVAVLKDVGQRSQSPFTLGALDSFEESGRSYVVMEQAGKPVGRVEGGETRPQRQAVQIAINTVRARQELHRLGYFHMDVHPKQILMNGDDTNTVKLIDYTFATRRGVDGKISNQSMPGCGYLNYVPPEKFNGAAVDSNYDLYMTAGVAYCLITGRPPFSGHGDQEAQLAERKAGPDLRAITDPGLAAVLQRAMAYNPADRYQRSKHLIEALLPFA